MEAGSYLARYLVSTSALVAATRTARSSLVMEGLVPRWNFLASGEHSVTSACVGRREAITIGALRQFRQRKSSMQSRG